MSGYNSQQRAKLRRLAKIILACSVSIFCVAAILYIWLDRMDNTNVAEAAEIAMSSKIATIDDTANSKKYDDDLLPALGDGNGSSGSSSETTKYPVTVPTIENATVLYDGTAKTFVINPCLLFFYTVTPGDGLTYDNNNTLTATEAGTYTVTLDLNNKISRYWDNTSNDTSDIDPKTITIKIVTPVQVPTVDNVTTTYDGTAKTYAITNLDKDSVTVTTDGTILTYDEEATALSATYAGNYTATFSLKEDYYIWANEDTTVFDAEDKTVNITIDKCKVEFTAEDIYYDYEGIPFYVNYPTNTGLKNSLIDYDWWSDDTYGNVYVMSIKMYQSSLEGAQVKRAASEDNYFIKFIINNGNYIWSDGTTEKYIILYFEDNFTNKATGTIDGNAGGLGGNGVIGGDSGSGSLGGDGVIGGGTSQPETGVKLSVVTPFTQDSPLKWQITNGDSETATEITYVVGANENIQYSDSDAYTVVYDGSQFKLSIDEDELAARGLKVKEYSDQVVETNASNTSYQTTVTLENLDDTWEKYSASYTIFWKIDFAKFDLSDVKWNYDGTLLDADEEDFAAQLINLPDGLVANYQTVSSEDAEALCTDYRTIVTFTLDTEKYPELANYYIPTEDGGNYINEGSSFSFELDWAKAAPFVFSDLSSTEDNYVVWETVLLCVGLGIIVAEVAAVVIQRKLHKKQTNIEDDTY